MSTESERKGRNDKDSGRISQSKAQKMGRALRSDDVK